MHPAPALLDDMKSASPPVGPDLVTYSTLVKGYCSGGIGQGPDDPVADEV